MKQLTIIDQDNALQHTLYDNGEKSIMREFEGFEYAEVRSVVEEVAGKKSAVHVTNKFGRRRSSVSGDLVGDDVFTTRRELLSVMRQTGSMKLIKFTTYDDLELQFEADIAKFIAPYNHKVQSYLIEFLAADWRFYSQTQKEISGGVGTFEMENEGNERTEAVFRVDGAFTEATITNLNNSESFVISETVEDGDYVLVDCFNREVLLNGTTPIFNSLSGEFFSLLPGVNNIQFLAEGDNGNTLLTGTYRDAYNGM